MKTKQKTMSLNATILKLCVMLVFIASISSVMANQIPVAIDAPTRCGLYDYVLNESNVIGDIGSHASPALGDLDADGDLDMIVGNSAGFFQHYRNDGNAWVNVNGDLFGDQGEHARPELVDWDADGDLDLLFVRGNAYLSLYENIGDKEASSFELKRDFVGTPWAYAGVSTADLDSDGDLDMIATSSNSRYTYYYENYIGEVGTDFDRANREYLGYTNDYAGCYFLDYDYDGDFDAVCTQDNGNVYIHRNIGNSTYQVWDDRTFQETFIDDYSDYVSFDFIDFDSDGDYDLFTGNSDGTVSYYEGTYAATGEFFNFTLNSSNFLGSDVGTRASPALYDIDNDGDLDMYVAEDNNDRITYYRNDGGSFSFIGLVSNLDSLGSFPRLSFKDMDDDGDADVMISNGNGEIRFYENSGSVSSPTWENPVTLIDIGDRGGADYEDIDGDGDLDVLSSEVSSKWARVYYNDGNATNPTISDSLSYTSITVTSNCFNPDFIDINEDGNLDLVTGECNGQIKYYKNSGNNTHPDYQYIKTWHDAGDWSAPDVVDIDNDGDYDVTWGRSNDNVIRHFEAVSSDWSTNWTINNDSLISDYGDYADIDLKDVDYDGDVDLLVGYSNGYIRFFLNEGTNANPQFTHITRWDDVGDWASPALGDFDNDGDYDYIWGRSNDNNVRHYENTAANHSINFTETSSNIISDQGDYARPAFADLDNDGDYDLVVGYSNGQIHFFNNTGSAGAHNYLHVQSIVDIGDWASPTLADFDNDGDYDIIAGRSNGNYLYYIENIGSPTSPSWTVSSTDFLGYSSGNNHLAPYAVDWDSDGDLDLITGQQNGNIRYNRNDGNETDPSWTYVTSWGDFGSYTTPAFVDFFNTSKYNLIWGRDDGLNYIYQNQASEPSTSWSHIRGYQFGEGGSYWMPDTGSHSTPTPIDIDSDGDLDLLVGNSDGSVKFYENHGLFTDNDTLARYPTFTNHNNNYLGVLYNNHATPHVQDYDGDGDLDVLVGYANGINRIFRNDGSISATNWIDTGSILDSGDYSKPILIDWDEDGVQDLITSHSDGMLRVYRNEGTNTSFSFRFIYSYYGGPSTANWMYDLGSYTSHAFFDFDADGDQDLFTGVSNGSVQIYKNDGKFTSADDIATYPSYIHRDNWIGDSYSNHGIPRYIDWDDDGDYDLVIGYSNGVVRYVRNDGSSTTPNWVSPTTWGDFGDYSSTEFYDFDEDGLRDMIVSRSDGTSGLYVNTGSVSSPSWSYIYSGEDGSTYFPDIGSHVNNFMYDVDEDGQTDMISCEYYGHCVYYLNKGDYTSEKEKRDNSLFRVVTGNIGTDNGGSYVNPKLVDMDGDGDYDILNGLNNGHVYFWKNNKNRYQYGWASIGSLGFDVGAYSEPAFGDLDGDGDLDLMVGDQDGIIDYYENQGSYNNTCVTITDDLHTAVSGVTIRFYNDTNGLVCDTTTDSYGTATCDLNLTSSGNIQVISGPDNGYIQLALTTYNSGGKTSQIIQTQSSSYDIDLEHFEVSSAGPKGDLNAGTQIKLIDRDAVVFKGHTNSSGEIEGFVAERYLVNRREAYSQNRIKYDVDLLPNEFYQSHLRLNDVYMPNSLSLGHPNDANKLFKFPAAKYEVTDARYKHYLIYPAVNAQKDFDFVDEINESFTLVNPITIRIGADEYLEECTFDGSTTTYEVNKTTSGCEILGNEISASGYDGDWVVVEYTVQSPGLALFLSEGWNTNNFTFPAASLGLKS